MELEHGSAYVMEVELGTLGDSSLSVLNAAGEELAYGDDSGRDLGSRIIFTPEQPGTYFVQVEGHGTSEGTYFLSLTTLEEYVSQAERITVGGALPGNITAGAPDLYWSRWSRAWSTS